MQWLTERNVNILKLIVEEYINTWELVWSKSLLKKHDLWVSPATVRNDMAKLEGLNLIFQPYHSAWRYPTNKWLRIFINYMMEQKPDYFIAPEHLNVWNNANSIDSILHNITYSLANTTWEISFVFLEHDNILKYSWISNFIDKNSKDLWDNLLNIVRVLEERNTFIRFLNTLNVSKNVTVILWEESKIPYLKDNSIILRRVEVFGQRWFIWLIWSLRMDYSFNISALRWVF